MFDRLPPLQTLRAFEAAGRLLSMTLAAEELHVTHGAVSRHIKALESHLGVALFQRLTRRIVLTEAGGEFLLVVTRALGELAGEAERLRGHDGALRLKINASVSFANKWLALAGVRNVRSDRGSAYSHGSLAIEAAIRGEGVARCAA